MTLADDERDDLAAGVGDHGRYVVVVAPGITCEPVPDGLLRYHW